MKPEDYELVRELFHDLADLSHDRRQEILRAKDVSPEIIAQVESLLEQDEEMGATCSETPRPLKEEHSPSDPGRVEKLAGLFEEALGHDEEQRRDFLKTLAHDVSEETTRLGSMKAETFFGKLRRIYGEGADPVHTVLPDSEDTQDSIPSRPETHDRYELRGQVAEGGMGKILRVWDKPLRRYIAMKVVAGSGSSDKGRSPSPSASFVRRFVEEAQITGQLDHPGVVPVHELAVNDKGKVFFTMRLVKGITFKDVIERVAAGKGDWNLTRAMNRLLRVCETMAFAHKRGVIHRDLKPANVMVGDFGETYVMDWGLAKILGEPEGDVSQPRREDAPDHLSIETERRAGDTDGADAPVYTIDGEVIGTPAYMPPEQARGEMSLLGSQADVYAMGAVLYHLLAGHPPYVPEGSRPSASEILDGVLGGPPRNLSDIARGIPEELIAICRKAMARRIEDRYPDMGAMAEDVRAYLEGRVVKAYRTGALVELNKWIIRNKKLAASIAVTILVALCGLSGMLILEAQRSREIEKEARTSARVVEFLIGMFGEEVPDRARGQQVTVKEVLDREVPRMASELENEPDVRVRILDCMGSVYHSLGLYPEAEPLFRTCLEIRRDTLGDSHADTLRSMRAVAKVMSRQGRYEEAEQLYLGALAEGEKVLGSDHPEILDFVSELGLIYFKLGRNDEAERYMREAFERRRRILGRHDLETLRTLNNLGVLLRHAGRFKEAAAVMEEVLQARRQQSEEDSTEILTIMGNLAQTYLALGRIEDAEILWRESLDGRRRILGEDHPTTIKNVHNLSNLLLKQGHVDEAIKGLREVLERKRRVLGEDNPDTVASMVSLAHALKQDGQYPESERLYLEAVPRVRQIPNPVPLQITLSGLAHLLVAQSRFEDATPLIVETMEMIRVQGGGPPNMIQEMEECIRRFEAFLNSPDETADPARRTRIQSDLARIYNAAGRDEEFEHLRSKLEKKEE